MTVTITTTTAPESPTLTVKQVKAWLNVPAWDTKDDDLIKDIIVPDVLDQLTQRTGVSYVKRRHVVAAAAFACLDFCLVGQGHAGWELKYHDADDAEQSVDAANYRTEVVGDRIIITAAGDGFPSLDSTRVAPVLLEFTTVATVEGTARTAALSLCSIRYHNRGEDWTERIPPSVRGMLDLLTPRRAH